MNNTSSKWTKHPTGYSVFASDLPREDVMLELPDGQPVSFRDFTPHRDRDNDITHWTASFNARVYTIFND